ncbi:MAG: hypothetical protein KF718_25745 [Polyangiaceae bacterium]|nr:hypothetical protein [Polyangiaceae bacterium]
MRGLGALLASTLLLGCSSGGSGGDSSSGGASSGGASSGGASSGGASSGGAEQRRREQQALAPRCRAAPLHHGEGTYYAATGAGNCSFDATPNDLMVAAMNQTDYADSAACGACAHIEGPSGQVTVRIVDRCPECAVGDIDLSPQAFEKIAELSAGRVDISWRYVPCTPPGPIAYRFKEGSNQWWTAVQIRDHRHAIATVEYESNGVFVPVARENYNYFVEPAGMGPGPYTFRVTDVYGHTLVDTAIPHQEAQVVPGKAQFPACSN